MSDKLDRVLDKVAMLLEQYDRTHDNRDLSVPLDCIAMRWVPGKPYGHLAPVPRPSRIRLDQLQGIDSQKSELERNTHQFVRGLPANNALLWGSRGTGKSSLVKAVLNEFSLDGLRMVEIDQLQMEHLPRILDILAPRLERYILFCDDLSFEAGDNSYKTLKAALDGSLTEIPDNVLVYATSNRRHLVPETMQDNLQAKMVDTEIHHGDAVEEKISLSERFGLWLSFYPFDQDTYLDVVQSWLDHLGHAGELQGETREAALRWALQRGSRSGRAAWQFARDWVGRKGY